MSYRRANIHRYFLMVQPLAPLHWAGWQSAVMETSLRPASRPRGSFCVDAHARCLRVGSKSPQPVASAKPQSVAEPMLEQALG